MRLPRPGLYPVTALLWICCVSFAASAAAQLPADLASKVEHYKVKLLEWGAHPDIVAAVRESNAQGGPIPGMNNGKWDELPENDPQVQAILDGPVSQMVKGWEGDKGINKLFVRDEKGNMVGGSSKSLLYNAAARPPFKEAMKGQAWGASKISPDPTTQLNSVHVSAPILDGDRVIGVIHSAVTAQ